MTSRLHQIELLEARNHEIQAINREMPDGGDFDVVRGLLMKRASAILASVEQIAAEQNEEKAA